MHCGTEGGISLCPNPMGISPMTPWPFPNYRITEVAYSWVESRSIMLSRLSAILCSSPDWQNHFTGHIYPGVKESIPPCAFVSASQSHANRTSAYIVCKAAHCTLAQIYAMDWFCRSINTNRTILAIFVMNKVYTNLTFVAYLLMKKYSYIHKNMLFL